MSNLTERVCVAIKERQRPPYSEMPDGAWFSLVAEAAGCEVCDVADAIADMNEEQLKRIGVEHPEAVDVGT